LEAQQVHKVRQGYRGNLVILGLQDRRDYRVFQVFKVRQVQQVHRELVDHKAYRAYRVHLELQGSPAHQVYPTFHL
jgi:hypothetical protein